MNIVFENLYAEEEYKNCQKQPYNSYLSALESTLELKIIESF
jgi:hypothetical protein